MLDALQVFFGLAINAVVFFYIAKIVINHNGLAARGRQEREERLRRAEQEREERLRRAEQALNDARDSYYDLLEQLKHDPTDADLYASALEAGRHYAALTREDGRVSVFDEISLNNDLAAATAGAKRVPQPTTAAPVSAMDRMRELEAMRQEGMVKDDEYNTLRARILQTL